MTPEDESKLLAMVNELVLRVRRIDTQLQADDNRRKASVASNEKILDQLNSIGDYLPKGTGS